MIFRRKVPISVFMAIFAVINERLSIEIKYFNDYELYNKEEALAILALKANIKINCNLRESGPF